MTCPHCGKENVDHARFCAYCGTRLDPASIEKEQVRVSVSPEALSVAPGASATFGMTVANVGTVVEHVRLRVEAPMDEWAIAVPASLRVMPGAREEAALGVHPPRSAEVPAGRHRAVVSVERDDGGRAVLGRATGTVEVQPVRQADVRIVPRHGVGRRNSRRAIELVNTGNAPLSVQLKAFDPDDAFRFGALPGPVELQVKASLSHRFDLRTRKPRWWGPPLQREFGVRAAWEEGGNVTASGEFLQKSWRLIIVIVLLLLLLVVLVMTVKPG
jgi:hypothetical protein